MMPERGVEHQIVGMLPAHWRAGLFDQPQQIPIADENAGEIGEAVPAQIEPPDVQRDGRQAKIGEGGKAGTGQRLARTSPYAVRAS